MKKLVFYLLFTPFFSTAQDKTLLAEGVSPNLYITHKVAAKENFYSIGRIYNISPREIAPFNKLQLENGLSLGQVLKIPLSKAGFFQSGTADADEVFVPVYYAAKNKEDLQKIALNHNDLPLETLKQWNNIKGNAVKNGAKLIVGYLKVKKTDSYLAKKGVGTTISSTAVATVKQEDKPAAKENPVKKATAEQSSTVTNQDRAAAVKNPDTKKEEIVNSKKEETNTVKTNKKESAEQKIPVIKEGTFKTLFETQNKNTDGVDVPAVAGVFKSTSGWVDGKYYCLYNNVLPGTIVKVTNKETGKFIYAKVLDAVPDIKQNERLQIIISNAAADVLGVAESNFECNISYSK